MVVNITVNGTERRFDCAPGVLLSELLRSVDCLAEEERLVLLDGVCVDAQLTLAFQAHGRQVAVERGLVAEVPVPALTCAEVEQEAMAAG